MMGAMRSLMGRVRIKICIGTTELTFITRERGARSNDGKRRRVNNAGAT